MPPPLPLLVPPGRAEQLQQRQTALNEAQRSLARCLEAESAAETAVSQVEREIARQTQDATDVNGSDEVVEAFGRWFRGERQHLMQARRRLEGIQAEIMRERAVVQACRDALERCERLNSSGAA